MGVFLALKKFADWVWGLILNDHISWLMQNCSLVLVAKCFHIKFIAAFL